MTHPLTRITVLLVLLLLLIPVVSAAEEQQDITVQIQKNGIPQSGIVINVTGDGTRTTDGTGRIALYKAVNSTVNMTWGTHSHDFTVRAYVYDYVWSVWEAPRHGSYIWEATLSNTSAYCYFADGRGTVTKVTLSLYTVNGEHVQSLSVNGATANRAFYDLVPTDSYILELQTWTGPGRDIPDLRHRQVLARAGGWGVAELPVSAEMMQFLIVCFVIALIGATSYLAGPHGALIGAVAAVGFWSLGWLIISPGVLAAAVVVAALGVYVRGGKDL